MTRYIGIGAEDGVVVPDADAFMYALIRCLTGPEKSIFQEEFLDNYTPGYDFKESLVEWFFSGNWIKEDA